MRKYLLAIASSALSVGALAQDPSPEVDESIDEIVVVGGKKPGDQLDVDALYEAQLRERLMKDLEALQKEEQEGRWASNTAGVVEVSSRMSLGYDPEEEARMRRETDFMDVQYETVKPASLFRVEF